MNEKRDGIGRIDPTRLTPSQRLEQGRRYIRAYVFDVHSPIKARGVANGGAVGYCTLEDPTLFEETMALPGPSEYPKDKIASKIDEAIGLLKAAAELLPGGYRYDKRFGSINKAIDSALSAKDEALGDWWVI